MYPVDNLNLSIDRVYHRIMEDLRADRRISDVSTDLLSLTDNVQRVFYVYDLLRKYKIIPLILKEDKCEFSSGYYRNLGNEMYQRTDLFSAWQYYNLALMYAPLTSTTYSLAVSNRSAVLAAMKEYEACIEDINMVFTLRYPPTIRDKLLKRLKQCEEGIKERESPNLDEENALADEVLTLKAQDRHEKYLDASSKLKVVYNSEMGRHVVATEDIEVGEVIVQEDPYVRVLLKTQCTICCAHCFSRKFNLYPCPYCCVTMYCSRTCVTEAWDQYHSFECPLIASLLKGNFTKLELLALRTTIRARTEHETWGQVFSVIAAASKNTNHEKLGCKKEGDKWVYSSKYYPSIHTLSTNIEKRDVSDIFQKAVSAAILMHYLAVANFVKTDDLILRERIKSFTADSLMRHLMTAPTNMHGITTNVENEDGNYVDEYNIGCGAYGFLSLLNHSCAPNVVRYTKLGTAQTSLIAIRPIGKGMQVLDNYGAHHAVHTKEERQAILKSQYKFTCVCEACMDDWPLYQGLEVLKILPDSIISKRDEFLNGNVVEALQKADKDRALKLYQPLCELATALEPYMPCKEAAECQEALKQCLAILSGVVTHGFSNFIQWELPCPRITPSVSSRFYTGQGAQYLA
uniref:Protein-lysine N-methyltransferase SMYD4 n=1 Tax=Heliothis virescens TaxID=7102 RepID=A0A2A4K7Z8_HELVI